MCNPANKLTHDAEENKLFGGDKHRRRLGLFLRFNTKAVFYCTATITTVVVVVVVDDDDDDIRTKA